jgi:signal transduction histidine kinase
VGELWEFNGTTAPGDFSPVLRAQDGKFIRYAPLPEPVQPTWHQLMSGSLDAEYVELRGVLTAASTNELTILTRDGKLKIKGDEERPLPRFPFPTAQAASYLNKILRIRGCLTAEIDWKTRQVKAGEIYLDPAIVSVEESGPQEPFSLPTKKIPELLRFDASASALQRTKVVGQIIYSVPGEYFLLDGEAGLRLLTSKPIGLQCGDLVEAVGFPLLGGASPVLREAQIHKTGSAPLPRAAKLRPEDLLNRSYDSMLVQLEALLLSDTVNPGERVLKLQTGPIRFSARLRPDRGRLKTLLAGSWLQLTGVYATSRGSQMDDRLDSFDLLLNGAEDVTVLRQPSWWTVRRALTAAGVLAGSLAMAFIWITLLRRKVEERTLQLQKQIEARQLVEQHRAMEQERTRVAQDLHDELGAGLTEVGILGALAKNPAIPAEKKERYLDQLTEAACSLVTGLDEIVWAVNPQYDSVASLASYYSLFAQRFLNLAGIACRLEIAERFPEFPFDSKLRHGIFLAFKEALNNVVRHSGATQVRLRIEIVDGQLIISVSDNGCGLEAATLAPGKDGIAGMRHRISKLGGTCHVAGRPGQGTTVEFRIPVETRAHGIPEGPLVPSQPHVS